jgi:hypothetical protein
MKRCEAKLLKKMCVLCQERQARFRWAGRVKWDRFHNVCFRCYRSQRDRLQSVRETPDCVAIARLQALALDRSLSLEIESHGITS